MTSAQPEGPGSESRPLLGMTSESGFLLPEIRWLIEQSQQAPSSFQMFHAIGEPGWTPVDQYNDVHL